IWPGSQKMHGTKMGLFTNIIVKSEFGEQWNSICFFANHEVLLIFLYPGCEGHTPAAINASRCKTTN
ncbi:TPA: hypothetical protein ACLGWU_004884, partial [Salmonella enterica]